MRFRMPSIFSTMPYNSKSVFDLPVYMSVFILVCTLSYSCMDTDDIADEVSGKRLPELVDFNFHIRPIISDKCFSCHGPDENSRTSELRLDTYEGVLSNLSSEKGRSIYPYSSSKSVLIKRIKSADPGYQMPPPESNLIVSPYEIALIEKWINQGAKWKKHWALTPPVKSKIPENDSKSWTGMNEIDHFILEKINLENLVLDALEVKGEADKERLLRRVHMDLTGLPPSVAEIDEFINDRSSDAYERVVNKLLNTSAHAERLAMEWMDVARYADSHGLYADGWRNMHPWRDWVIKSFNRNMPYDDFIKKQLGGDLLPNATKDDIIATAFNRNHPMTSEGGTEDEEWRLNYVFDRTETMSTALLGMTIGCARCHDHKYDPISQKEYYQLASFFNNIKEVGMIGNDGNYGPILNLNDEINQQQIVDLKRNISAKEVEIKVDKSDLDSIKRYVTKLGQNGDPPGFVTHVSFDKRTASLDKKGKTNKVYFDNNENYFTLGQGKLADGKYGKALVFENDYSSLYLANEGQFEMTDEFSISLWINSENVEDVRADSTRTQTIIGNSGEKNNFWRGWDMYLDEENYLNARLISTYPHDYLHVRSLGKIDTAVWSHVGFTYDGSGESRGLHLFVDAILTNSEIIYDNLSKSIRTLTPERHRPDNRPLVIGKSGRRYSGENGTFYGRMDDIKIFSNELSEYEMSSAAGTNSTIDKGSLEFMAHRMIKQKARREIKYLREKVLELTQPIEDIMVMKENEAPGKMRYYYRKENDIKEEEVSAGTPSAILEFRKGLPLNRLGLVEWLFEKKNPLTARVAVNRYWQMIFGNGLVTTPEDFGNQGAPPTHPELLDWLAVDFVDSGWNLRHLIKKMVMSSTYRQSSICPKDERQKDPDNKWLSRGSTYRLSAEMIRDNALAASGLLNKKVGGASVRPYQPDGLWKEKGNLSNTLLEYNMTKGDSLYRRSLYTFVRRNSPHPMMRAFDVPTRDICIVKRKNSNTPLQALVLMNDPQFVEAAKVLAERMQKEGGKNVRDQITFAFRSSTGRKPNEMELHLLINLYEVQIKKYEKLPNEAAKLLDVGEYQIDENLNKAKTAALTLVTNTILNHDDTYTKR